MLSNRVCTIALLTWTSCVFCITTTWKSSQFIGYYIAPDSTEALTAENAWVTSGAYAGDCVESEGSRCTLATDCRGGTAFLDNDSSTTCEGSSSCVSFTIFQTFPDGLPSALNIGCYANWRANTVYKEVPASATPSSTTAPPTGATTGSDSSGTTAAPTSSPTNSQTSTPTPEPEKSKAWIAGAVIGPVAGIALIAAGFLLWRRRKAKADVNGQGPSGPDNYQYPQQYAPVLQQHSAEKATHQPPAELPSTQRPSELPS